MSCPHSNPCTFDDCENACIPSYLCIDGTCEPRPGNPKGTSYDDCQDNCKPTPPGPPGPPAPPGPPGPPAKSVWPEVFLYGGISILVIALVIGGVFLGIHLHRKKSR